MDKQAELDKIWAAYKKKRYPRKRKLSKPVEDIDQYVADKIERSMFRGWR